MPKTERKLTQNLAENLGLSCVMSLQVRLMLATVGRGGDGQAIRDEILHIMHRNHIPELKGTWMEEWHQKLHNNTTPDDVPICKARSYHPPRFPCFQPYVCRI